MSCFLQEILLDDFTLVCCGIGFTSNLLLVLALPSFLTAATHIITLFGFPSLTHSLIGCHVDLAT